MTKKIILVLVANPSWTAMNAVFKMCILANEPTVSLFRPRRGVHSKFP